MSAFIDDRDVAADATVYCGQSVGGPQPRQSSADANACVGVTSRQTAMRRDDTSTSLHPGYRLGSDRGSPNAASTLLSKRVMAQIRSPARVRTYTPVPCRMPVGGM